MAVDRRVYRLLLGCDMSEREDSRQAAGRASVVGDASQRPAANGTEVTGDVVHASLDQLRADAYNARRQRDLLATKVALLAYKLQMNSQDRRHQQVCQASFCGRLVLLSRLLALRMYVVWYSKT